MNDREALLAILQKRRVDSEMLSAIIQHHPEPAPAVYMTIADLLAAIRKKEDSCR